MKPKALLSLAALVILGVFIWLRELDGKATAAEMLPILATFPLYLLLTLPWKQRLEPGSRPPASLFAGAILFAAGVAADSNLALAVAWVALLDGLQRVFFQKIPRRFLLLPFLGFPWVTQNLDSLGWVFRYTGAGAVQILFTLLGLTVHREGTLLYVQNLPLSIEPACAGLNVLQSMLIVGTFLICFTIRKPGWRFWAAVAALTPLAWIANTARIFTLGCAGVLFGPEFARGWFHQWGGWLVLCLMFLLCERVFRLMRGGKSTAV